MVYADETVDKEITYWWKGKQRISREIVSPIRTDGKIIGILGTNIDMTEQKEKERLILQSVIKEKQLNEELFRIYG